MFDWTFSWRKRDGGHVCAVSIFSKTALHRRRFANLLFEFNVMGVKTNMHGLENKNNELENKLIWAVSYFRPIRMKRRSSGEVRL